ncbi:FAD-dependent oxidoreductase [Aridibaculum aurantiacum]|uniref:FAD-dependent oxidoreductase n=1 Tax=Aridibaculum aurantiacum TaxID=2810307 RepID=UPI001A97B65A|nr:NAD(P)/FAD-dependent oxidoreductase [Aridibaculum aurantiacum]
MSDKKVVIVGAGLVGSLLSIFLAKRGHEVKIYERREDMRSQVVEAGRSINLALSDRGIKALEAVGIAEEVMQIAIPMRGRMIHHADGNKVFQPYGKEGQAINSVSRSELNKKLMDIAEQNNVEIIFRKKCSTINWEKNEVVFDDTTTLNQDFEYPNLIIGADGAYSAARLQHMLSHPMFEYHQYYIDCGYKELAIPAGLNGEYLLDKEALHIWPRKDYMLIALPNLDGSFTGTLFFPFKGDTSFEKLDTEEKVNEFFKQDFPDVVELIPDLAEQFFKNPTSSLVTVKCFPWVRDDKFALIGDAAHAIVPFFGQGMNAGFEDCVVLNQLMDKHGDDWVSLLQEFQTQRKPDADAIADMAVNNFIEMREKTADPKFLLQKKIEARLHDRHPDKWIPAYSQVTFSPHIRYSEALSRGMKQEAIMQEVMQLDNLAEKWDSDEVEWMILEKL